MHDPRDVAHIAAVLLSATGQVEPHHVKAAVDAARNVLTEAHRRADEDEAAAEIAARGAALVAAQAAEMSGTAKTQ